MGDGWLIVSCIADIWMNARKRVFLFGPRKRQKMGRKPIISDDVITNAQGVAEVKDLSKDSATSSQEILKSIDHFRRIEQDEAESLDRSLTSATPCALVMTSSEMIGLRPIF